ncbi:hypothetical protein K4K58_013008 [Colletotrichum sp. SAR11_239]|nr:hypothetical protein K4K58_013008 [Colletotrichum sp. SAR11_239]
MAAPDEEESFRRFLEEMSGDSRDHGIRKTLDQRVHAYFKSFDAGRINEMERWYADDITFITSLQKPGSIFKGKDEVIARHEERKAIRIKLHKTVRSVPTLVVVDRGRITCLVERFYTITRVKPHQTTKYINLWVFDLDGTGHVKRLECRVITKSAENRPIEALVREAEAKQEDMQTCIEA